MHPARIKIELLGALGVVEIIGAQVAGVQSTLTPVMRHCTLLNSLQGGAAVNVFAPTYYVDLIVVDAGVAGESLAQIIGRGTGLDDKGL